MHIVLYRLSLLLLPGARYYSCHKEVNFVITKKSLESCTMYISSSNLGVKKNIIGFTKVDFGAWGAVRCKNGSCNFIGIGLKVNIILIWARVRISDLSHDILP